MLGVGHVVTTSVGMCDIDIRPVIISISDAKLANHLFSFCIFFPVSTDFSVH